MQVSTRTLVVLGVVVGLIAGMALAAVFDPGDAGKVSDGVAFGSPTGMNVTIYGEANVSMDSLFPDSRTVELNTSAGNISLAADNPASASVHTSNMTGAWTNVTEVTAGGTWVEVYPSDKQRVDTRGDVNQLSIRSMALDDGTPDFWVSGTDGGAGSVRVYNLPAGTTIAAVDANTGTFLGQDTVNSAGVATFSIDLSSHTVELKTVDPDPPDATNGRPTGVVSDTPSELKVDVSDADFPNDEVEVRFWLDGVKIDEKNITSDGTVKTTNISGPHDLGTTHRWNVTAVDAYGNVDTENYTYTMPENITLRNETNASQLITNQTITATFYADNGEIVVQKSDSNGDGNISLRGLPATSFVVAFEGENWHDRRAYIESIGNQRNIYLLNSTAYPTGDDSAIETTFVYEDRTGAFEQKNTTLEVERAVDPDGDGNFEWQVVAGDFWGAAGEFPFTGQFQTRYRLRITNRETGRNRLLGTHIPISDGVKNIIVGKIIFEADAGTGRFVDAGINQNTSNLQILYSDPANSSTDVQITVHEQGNKSHELYNQTFAGPLGTKVITQSLTDNQTDMNWIVTYDVGDTADGKKFYKVIVGGGSFPIPIDADILAAFSYLFVTFGMLLYGPRTALLGAWAGVILFAGFAFLGWVSGVTVAVPVLVAIGATFYSEASP